jgi:ankyrin repeat protein
MVQRGATALHIVSQKGYTAVVQLLLIHGATTDIQNNVKNK